MGMASGACWHPSPAPAAQSSQALPLSAAPQHQHCHRNLLPMRLFPPCRSLCSACSRAGKEGKAIKEVGRGAFLLQC
eukprot:61075-Pelagomonas_calceolata.AAC.2